MLWRNLFILVLVLSLAISASARAATETAFDARAFEGALARLKAHPEVAAGNARAEALSDAAEGTLGLPDPMLFIAEQDLPLGASTSQDFEQKMLGVRQQMPAFGTRSAKSARAVFESRKTRLAARYAFARLKARLITTLAGLHNLKQQDRLLAAQLALTATERQSLTGRIAANRGRMSDLAAIDAETARIELARAELEERRHELQEVLRSLLGDAPELVPPPLAPLAGSADPEHTYPVLLAADEVAMAAADVDLRAAEFAPAFEMQASAGRMRNGDNSASFMVGVSIPLWAADSQAPNLRAAEGQRDAAELERDQQRREVSATLAHLRLQITSSEKKSQLWTTKIISLTRGRDAVSREYAAGKAELADTLKAARDILDARMALIEEAARHTALIADYNRYFVTGDGS
jgi:outer membrane protein TolC